MCQAIAEGGKRCPLSGGQLPHPKNRQERDSLRWLTAQRRAGNARAAAEYRVQCQRITAEVERWSQDRTPDEITAELEQPQMQARGMTARRRALEAALISAQARLNTVPVPPTPKPAKAPSARQVDAAQRALADAERKLNMATLADAPDAQVELLTRRRDAAAAKVTALTGGAADMTPAGQTVDSRQPTQVRDHGREIESMIAAQRQAGVTDAQIAAQLTEAAAAVPDSPMVAQLTEAAARLTPKPTKPAKGKGKAKAAPKPLTRMEELNREHGWDTEKVTKAIRAEVAARQAAHDPAEAEAARQANLKAWEDAGRRQDEMLKAYAANQNQDTNPFAAAGQQAAAAKAAQTQQAVANAHVPLSTPEQQAHAQAWDDARYADAEDTLTELAQNADAQRAEDDARRDAYANSEAAQGNPFMAKAQARNRTSPHPATDPSVPVPPSGHRLPPESPFGGRISGKVT